MNPDVLTTQINKFTTQPRSQCESHHRVATYHLIHPHVHGCNGLADGRPDTITPAVIDHSLSLSVTEFSKVFHKSQNPYEVFGLVAK